MAVTIEIDIPRQSLGVDLTAALAASGLRAELVETDDRCMLEVSFSDDRETLVDAAVHAIETHLAETGLPLVVQRSEGGAVLRPPSD